MTKEELQLMVQNATEAAIVKNAAPAVQPKPDIRGARLRKQWRPYMMILFMVVIVNNYIVAPYLSAYTGVQVVIELPPELMTMMMGVAGIYALGRSAEKGVDIWTHRKTKDPMSKGAA